MLLNREGKVFVAQRLDSTLEAWQMPQGGLDEGEEAEAGALRELEEETGIPRDKVEIVARCPVELTYDLPDDLVGKMWKGQWRGQRQTWFLLRFTGEDSDVNLETAEPGIPRLEMGRSGRAPRADRAVQEAALRGRAEGVRRLALSPAPR